MYAGQMTGLGGTGICLLLVPIAVWIQILALQFGFESWLRHVAACDHQLKVGVSFYIL